jgi:hypothetical protein
MSDLLVFDSGVLWGWRSIPLYMKEAIYVYRCHLGGANTMPARPGLESRDGIMVKDERRWSPHGNRHPDSGGEVTRKFLRKSSRELLRELTRARTHAAVSGPRCARKQQNENSCESLRDAHRDIRCERHLQLPCPRLAFVSRDTQSSRKSLRESSRWCCRMRNMEVKMAPPMSFRSRDGSTRKH